jgi:hypothetical protein
MSRRQRLLFITLAGPLVLAGYFGLRALGVFDPAGAAEVRPLADGHHEVAFLGPATAGETWERLVAAAQLLEKEWPQRRPGKPALRVDSGNAFPPSTIEVPELRLWLQGAGQHVLWVRWYKLSSEINAEQWLTKLAGRPHPPLAVVGGESSNQALQLARTLDRMRRDDLWAGPAPLLLITSATADRFDPREGLSDTLTEERFPRLMDVYQGRSYRFCFTNNRMAEAVVEFLAQQPQVWPRPGGVWAAPAGAAGAGAAGPFAALAPLGAAGLLAPAALYAVAWADDRYSLDLADRFAQVFVDRLPGSHVTINSVPYGVGLADQPNPSEAEAADRLLAEQFLQRGQRQTLALPTATTHARRFLRTLARQAPLEVRNLVVLTGDSIGFDSLFRDRVTAWNVQDVPASLVCFSHRDPVDLSAGFRPAPAGGGPTAATGTHDLLLYRDILEGVTLACSDDRAFVHAGEAFHHNVADLRWLKSHVTRDPADRNLFAADGNRHDRTGERILWLRPAFDGTRVLPQAELTVWWIPRDVGSDWRVARDLVVPYNGAPGRER